MTIAPRATEIAAVTAILESDDYESPKAMARAIVVTCAKELQKRTALMVGLPTDESGTMYPVGPFWTSKEAESFAKACAGRYVLPPKRLNLGPPARTLKTGDDTPESRALCTCGHGAWMHSKVWGCSMVTKKVKCPCSSLNVSVETSYHEP